MLMLRTKLISTYPISLYFSYVVGGRFLKIFTEFYVFTPDQSLLPLDSPKWIGAWWLGFLLIVVLSYISAATLAIFPASIPGSRTQDHKKSKDYAKLLKDFPMAIWQLGKNASYMFISLGATMDGFLLAGKRLFYVS